MHHVSMCQYLTFKLFCFAFPLLGCKLYSDLLTKQRQRSEKTIESLIYLLNVMFYFAPMFVSKPLEVGR